MPPGAWWGLCRCPGPAGGSTYKNSKLCTGRTHAAPLGNSSDPLWPDRGGQEALMAGVCNQYLQLASAPDGLKGSAIKHAVPRCRSSPTPPCHAEPFRLRRWQPGPAVPRGSTQHRPERGEYLLVTLMFATRGAARGRVEDGVEGSGLDVGPGCPYQGGWGAGDAQGAHGLWSSRGERRAAAPGWLSAAGSSRSLHLRAPLCSTLACSNTKLLMTLNKLISGLNSLLGGW